MSTINLKATTYAELQNIMQHELKEKLKKPTKEIIKQLAQNKLGLTYDNIVIKLILEYKHNHKIT